MTPAAPAFAALHDAVADNIRPGDRVHVVMGHSRWTAAARELARQGWGADLGLELVMFSLSSLGALFFASGLVRRVITAHSGNAFPADGPNPIFQRAYASGDVEVEHWSSLSLLQRIEAAARGLPVAVTGSLHGSSMAGNAGYREVETEAGSVGLVDALAPDVALLHAPVADAQGNVALAPPLLEAGWAAFAARRGAVVTVERVVEDLRPWSSLVRIPAHRVLAIVEAPWGAHPGGLYAGALPADGYAEDIPFWTAARDAARRDFEGFARAWCLETETHDDYLMRLGEGRLSMLRRRAAADSWRLDDETHPVDAERPTTAWETAAAFTAREIATRVVDLPADTVLAGEGVANLAAWVGVARARAAGAAVQLTAELGLWDYTPTPADPFVFNHRSFPSAAMLTDAEAVLGVLIGGPGTRSIACVGTAQVDAAGNLNTTLLSDGTFLVGSGGANDAVTRAGETLVVTLMTPDRTPESVGYVTSPGDRVQTVVTDLGVLRKRDGELRLAAVPAGDGSVDDRAREAVAACGWPLEVDRDVAELDVVEHAEVMALREYDRRAWFLGEE